MTAPSLTTQQVLALAPDPASAKAGQGLGTPRRWVRLGGNERAAWGECQGSGSTPYQTQVDLNDLTTRCSCPSRKFPCKHALGLLLLRAADPTAFQDGETPAWVAQWLAGRDERAEARAERATTTRPVDETARARRVSARQDKMRAGMEELGLWLRDLVRGGLAGAPARPYADWETMAARLVDAQTPGAARLVRELPGVLASGPEWPERLLERLGRLHLLVEGMRRADALPADLRDELYGVLGWSPDTAEVLARPPVRDTWAVLGSVTEEQERLTVRRTWLRGETGLHDALVVDFAHASGTLPPALPVGTRLDAELCFYPGRLPLRAAVRERHGVRPLHGPLGEPGIEEGLARHARALARNPWLERFPLTLAGVRTVRTEGRWLVLDARDRALPLHPGFTDAWTLHALGGGHPVSLSGEWDGDTLRPVGMGDAQSWWPLGGFGMDA